MTDPSAPTRDEGDGRGRAPLGRLQRTAFLVGVAGIVLCVIGAIVSRDQFFRSYLYAYLFWLGVPLGCGGLLMLQNLTGGRWGLVIRRPLEAGTRMLPLIALLFIPILLGLQDLYIWARPEAVSADEALQYKQPYLNVVAFTIRAAVYFAAWIVGVWLLNRWSDRHERTGDPAVLARLRALSGPGLIVYVLSMSAASIDWVMSIDPHWYSTMFGVIFIIGQALSAMASMIVVLSLLSRTAPLAGLLTRDDFHDLGNLLMAFVMFWAYVQFSQFLIIWMANTAEEVPFYAARMTGWVAGVSLSLIILHFAVPFALLLSRHTKRSVRALTAVAAAILVMRFVDLYWIVMPTFAQAHLADTVDAGPDLVAAPTRLHWLDLVTPLAIGGIWVAVYIRELGRRPLLPANDPRLLAAAAHDHGEHHG